MSKEEINEEFWDFLTEKKEVLKTQRDFKNLLIGKIIHIVMSEGVSITLPILNIIKGKDLIHLRIGHKKNESMVIQIAFPEKTLSSLGGETYNIAICFPKRGKIYFDVPVFLISEY